MDAALWVVDGDEIVGPCGHRLPNTPDGHRQAEQHECDIKPRYRRRVGPRRRRLRRS